MQHPNIRSSLSASYRMTGTLLLALFTLTTSLAQDTLSVTLTTPTTTRLDPLAPIGLAFNLPLDTTTIDERALRVFGRWSGPVPGRVTFGEDGRSLYFHPSRPYFAGEQLTVSLARTASPLAGEPAPHGRQWQYWVRTLGNGQLHFTATDTLYLREPGETWIQTYGGYAGDVNADGWSDLIMVNEFADDLRILLNDGEGQYSGEMSIVPMGSESASPSEGGDFNGDGILDLVVTTVHDAETRVLFGDGQGGFPTIDRYVTGQNTRAVVVLDLEGDGDDDIITANRAGNNLNLLWNDGEGRFERTIVPTPLQSETSLGVGDVNGDGILDLFLGGFNSEDVGLLLGDGRGGFTLTDRAGVPGRPWMLAAGDLDGDGRADAVSANSGGNSLSVLLSDSLGGFRSVKHYYPPNNLFPLAIDLGDLDGDGDLDVVSSHFASNNFLVLLNDGQGALTLAADLSALENASCALLHDRDNDGDLDLTGTDETDDVAILFENTAVTGVKDRQAPDYPLTAYRRGEQLYLHCPDCPAGRYTWSVMSSEGRAVMSTEASLFLESTAALSVPDLPAGFYWLVLSKAGRLMGRVGWFQE